MSKNGKVRAHKLSKRKSFVPALIITLLMVYGYYILAQFVFGGIISVPFVIFYDRETAETATTAAVGLGGFIALFIYILWFRPEYQWKPRNTRLAFLLSVPLIIYELLLNVVFYAIAVGHFTFGLSKVTFMSVFFALQAGICEEVAFREIGISHLKRQVRDDKFNIPILLILSVAFGATHLINILNMKAPFYYVFIQVFWTILIGIFFGGVFMRTGNIWPCIITHALHDLFPVFFLDRFDLNDYPLFIYVVITIGHMLLATWGLYLVRKEKHPEIHKLWEEKWQIAEENGTMK
ncbi:MAG: CPBP family intramembrane metalloprotease [Ruminococcus sp.]|nr:CPBP family intramembrane metalloprotease [Ruminococcus sp.]